MILLGGGFILMLSMMSMSLWVLAEDEDDEGDEEFELQVEEGEAFFRERAPIILEVLEFVGERDGEEEAIEKGLNILEQYHQFREMAGPSEADAYLQFHIYQARIQMLIIEAEIEENAPDDFEKQLEELGRYLIKFQNQIDKARIKILENEIAEVEEAIDFRQEEPDEAIEDLIHQAIESLFGEGEGEGDEFDEHDEEWEDHDDREASSGPVYSPSPNAHKDINSELASVGFHFDRDILVTLEEYCYDCHDSLSAKGDIDLEMALSQKPLVKNLQLWKNVAERVRNGDMPPPKKPQPSDESRLKLRAWVEKDIVGFNYDSIRNPGFVPARRLSRAEYNHTIRDLVGVDLKPADAFPMDFTGTSGFSNSANTLYIQSANMDRYFTSADWIIETLQTKHQNVWNHLMATGDAQSIISDFMFRAFRRPPSSSELANHMAIYDREVALSGKHEDGIARVLKSILVSPYFLMKSESYNGAEGDMRLSGYEMASRLSYFLWASMPDDALFKAAGSGRLSSDKDVLIQVERMLSDRKSLALGEIFAQEWLGVDDVGPRIRKDPIDSPWCTETLMAAMRNETGYFFHSLVTENAPVSVLVNANYTYMNEELARFYRVQGVSGDGMRKVVWEGNRRGGVLGHAAILAATSYPDRTSPVLRGTWILDTLLGTPPPPPPPNVPDLEDVEFKREVKPGDRSLRAKLELHRDSPNCAGCHSRIDPLGFALENFATFGQMRRGRDDAGTLPNGASFRGLAGLKLALIDNSLDDLGKQVIRKMLAYGLGRQLEYYDEGTVIELAHRLKPEGYLLGDTVKAISTSLPFTHRRIPVSNNP